MCGRVGQFDWSWRVQGEDKLRAVCAPVGLRAPGGSGRKCRLSGHLALTVDIMTRKREIKEEESGEKERRNI